MSPEKEETLLEYDGCLLIPIRWKRNVVLFCLTVKGRTQIQEGNVSNRAI